MQTTCNIIPFLHTLNSPLPNNSLVPHSMSLLFSAIHWWWIKLTNLSQKKSCDYPSWTTLMTLLLMIYWYEKNLCPAMFSKYAHVPLSGRRAHQLLFLSQLSRVGLWQCYLLIEKAISYAIIKPNLFRSLNLWEKEKYYWCYIPGSGTPVLYGSEEKYLLREKKN